MRQNITISLTEGWTLPPLLRTKQHFALELLTPCEMGGRRQTLKANMLLINLR